MLSAPEPAPGAAPSWASALNLLIADVIPADGLPRHVNTYNYVKGKGLDTCYSATYISQTRDQQRFTISEVAADWHEPMVPQRIIWASSVR